MSGVLLQARGLRVQTRVRSRAQTVLAPCDVSLHAGQWCALVGPNGAGKSTLLAALAGVLPEALRVQGERWLVRPGPSGSEPGQDALMPWHCLSRRERSQALAWLGAENEITLNLPVHELVALARLVHRGSEAARHDALAVQEALKAFAMHEAARVPVWALSSGERQRVGLARAWAVQARVLLLDEPLVNLDPVHQALCLQRMREHAQQGGAVLSVLHDLTAALQADRLWLMQKGALVHTGAPDDPATHAALRQVFGAALRIERVAGQWVSWVA